MHLRYLLVLLLLPTTAMAQPDSDRGRLMFEGNCSRCHGMQGTGGEGPSLARPFLTRARDDGALARIIQRGIRGTGMPGMWAVSDYELGLLVAYVRLLGRVEPEEVPGDRDRGRDLFQDKGGCTECHTVGGFGTSMGPDLTLVGRRRSAAYLRESLIDPAAALPRDRTFLPSRFAEYLLVRVVTRDGQEMRGIRVNEDSYTIQLRDEEGGMHSFRKEDLDVLDKQFGESLMPNYGEKFSDGELDDIVAYLASLRGGDG